MDPPPIAKRLLPTDSNGLSPKEDSSLLSNLSDHNSKRIRLTLPPPQQSTPAQPPSHNNVPAQNGLLPFQLRQPIFSSQKQPQQQINDSLPPVLPTPFTPPPLSIPQAVQELPSIDSFSVPLQPILINNVEDDDDQRQSRQLEEEDEDDPYASLRPSSHNNHHNGVSNGIGSSSSHASPTNSTQQLQLSTTTMINFHENTEERNDQEYEEINGNNEEDGEEEIEREYECKVEVEVEEEEDGDDEDNFGIYSNTTPRRPQLIVQNDDSLNMQGIEERRLGYVVYNPKEILPPLEFMENGLLEVWIPSQHLIWDNTKVRKRWLWGTDVYTDDSDTVAVLIHTGYFTPKPPKSQWPPNFPDYDLCVTIRVLPKLVQYTSCSRNRIKSRSWGNHHGVSFKIESVRKMKEGEALGRARGGGRKQRLQRFHRLKRLAFGDSDRDNSQLFEQSAVLKFNIDEQSAVLKFNIDGDPCFKYSPHLMANQENLAKQFRKEVMFLENDEERYEISYDPRYDRYRVAVVLPSIQLNEAQLTTTSTTRYSETNSPFLPLEKSNLEEILRDDLILQDIEWVNVGVIVKDRVNTPQSLLIVLRRVFWRKRTHEVVSPR
ncbi:6690_t:CDS:2 [Ambispora gerdemannii]|uniref:6690_t:CDS:1 n=1 Tax=Ambispora gerdemannii TaxID=144530 RepID=A0A9N9A7F1_9GLOM|nr:6690_t:CDS:2 [Ambispora gerdemannii]